LPDGRTHQSLANPEISGAPRPWGIAAINQNRLPSNFLPENTAFWPFGEPLYIKLGEFRPRELAVVTGYCVYEKKKNREIKNPKQIKLKNGRPAIKGTCASCGKQIFRIGKLK
jgi:hypothetical protein